VFIGYQSCCCCWYVNGRCRKYIDYSDSLGAALKKSVGYVFELDGTDCLEILELKLVCLEITNIIQWVP